MAKHLGLTPEHFKSKPKMPPVIRPREIRNIPGVKGTLPMRAGEVVLTPEEEARLRSFGWNPGDPIPGNLPDFIKGFELASRQLPEEVRQEILTTPPAPPGTPPTQLPQPIDISQLTAAKRAEIEAYLHNFKKSAPQIERAMKARENMDKVSPSIQKAIVAAENDGIEVYDSRQGKQKVAQEIDNALGTQFVTAADVQKRIDVAEGKRRPDVEDIDDIPELAEDEVQEVDIPYEDRAGYLAAIMAMKPFKKIYTLYGGRIKLAFKQLDVAKSEMVMNQVAHTARVGLISQVENIQLGFTYSALFSLESVTFQGETINLAEEVDEYIEKWKAMEDREDDNPSPLDDLVEIIQKQSPFNNVVIWRAIRQFHDKFQKLVDELEAKADDPGFWQGIGV